MRLAIPVQERPARNALTVGLCCANHTRKPVARVARFSACPVFSAIKRNTQSLSQWPTDGIENEKPREDQPYSVGIKRVHGTKHGSSQRP